MEEKESSKEKLLVNNNQVRDNFVSEETIIEKSPCFSYSFADLSLEYFFINLKVIRESSV